MAVAALSTFIISSCTIETSGNGTLDGYWHLVRVDTLSTGGSMDLSNRRIFWGIQHKLVSVKDMDKNSLGFYLRFEQTDDKLLLKSPYINHWHQDQGEDGGDIPLDNAIELSPFGINQLEEEFEKEALDGTRMVLKSTVLRLYFNRF